MTDLIHTGDWDTLGLHARAIRDAVFIEEQGISEALEHDDRDRLCIHAVLFVSKKAVGAGRIDPKGKIGRLAVLPPFRGQGHGCAIMAALEDIAHAQGLPRVYVHAQSAVVPFYLGLGYRAIGEEMMEAGIPHRFMEKDFKS